MKGTRLRSPSSNQLMRYLSHLACFLAGEQQHCVGPIQNVYTLKLLLRVGIKLFHLQRFIMALQASPRQRTATSCCD